MGTGWRRAFCTSIRRDPPPPDTATSTTTWELRDETPTPRRVAALSTTTTSSSCVKLGMGIFSGSGGGRSSNSSTPRRLHSSSSSVLSSSSAASTPRCPATPKQPTSDPNDSPIKLQCKTTFAAATATTKSDADDHTPCRPPSPSPRSKDNNNSRRRRSPSSSPRLLVFQSAASSSSPSPRSPSKFALLKTALRLSRNRCGICGESVRSGGQGSAVFTAECSHAFHFPCISSHVRAQRRQAQGGGGGGSGGAHQVDDVLVCPVCSAIWQDAPLLSSSALHLHYSSPVDSAIAAAAAADDDDGSQQQRDSQLICKPAAEERGINQHPRQQSPRDGGGRGRRVGERSAASASASGGGITGTKSKSKIYDDDESLQLSPTSQVAGGLLLFNPIPEEELEEDDSPSDAKDDSSADQGRLKVAAACVDPVSVIPDSVALVSIGRNHLCYVVSIKIKARRAAAAASATKLAGLAAAAPPPSSSSSIPVPPSLLDHPSSRAPVDLVTVLDVSGSMTVEKLQMLKRAMRSVIASLGPGDRLSIVAFSVAAAKRLLPLRRMSRPGQRCARQIVDRLVVSSSAQSQSQSLQQAHEEAQIKCPATPARGRVGDALRKATKILEDRKERNPVATIMLLSDGQRHGQTSDHPPDAAAAAGACYGSRSHHQTTSSSATRLTHIEIPIHCSSGSDVQLQQHKHKKNLNMPFVVEEREHGLALARHVKNGFASPVLQDVRLQLTTGTIGISSVYSFGDEHHGGVGQAMAHGEGGKSVCLGDLYAEEERHLLVELKVPKAMLAGTTSGSGQVTLSISVACSYRDPLSGDLMSSGDYPLVMPIPPLQSPQHHQIHSQPHRFAALLLRSSSFSSSSSQQQHHPQQHLRNLFVGTRAVAESRRLVEINDLDTALHLLSTARSLLLQQSTAVLDSIAHKKLVRSLDAQLEYVHERQQQAKWQQQQQTVLVSPSALARTQRRSEQSALLGEVRGSGGGGEPLTPTSAWRAAEQLAKVAIKRKSLNRVSDLHGFENARF